MPDGKPPIAQKRKIINAVDLFCGAGGTSTGLIYAVNELGYEIKLTAINHWDVAIATHSRNHEDVIHHCQSIETLNPKDIIKGGRLQLLVASPECIHHSNARGGKPRSDQKRADAWMLMRWIEKLYVENILIENVKEFRSWGPLTAAGKPDKRHKGVYFNMFIDALRINYTVEYDVLTCADYGDPTTRQRLFILARRGKKKIIWPKKTHASRKELKKLEDAGITDHGLEVWNSARGIIDWSLEGKSIFGRKVPLKFNTMKRIFAGLGKYSLPGLNNGEFIVPQFSEGVPRGVDDPLSTITGSSRGMGVVNPFMVNLKNTDRRDRGIDEPTFTQMAGGNHQAVCESFVMSAGGNTNPAKCINDPLGAILGSGKFAVVEREAFVLGQQSGSVARDVSEPVPTVAGKGAVSLVELLPFLIKNYSGSPASRSKSLDEPLGAVTANFNHDYLVQPFLVKYHGDHVGEDAGLVDPVLVNMKGKSEARDIDEPVFTQTGKNHQYVAEPFVFNMAHTGDAAAATRHESYCRETDEPIPTIAGKGMFGVVDPFVLNMQGDHPQNQSIDEPIPTLLTGNHKYVVEPCLVKYYGSGDSTQPVSDPLATVTTRDRFGLVEGQAMNMKRLGRGPKNGEIGLCLPHLGIVIFVRFRMLQPHELAAAMSFPKEYHFEGNREAQVKQIGNSVPRKTATALCRALLAPAGK